MDLEELYQEVILDHSRRPRNFGELPDATASVHGDNPMCGDEVTVNIHLSDADVVDGISFTGNGCSICMASASLMTLKVKNRGKEETQQFADDFVRLLTASEETPPRADFGDLKLLAGVRKFPQRVKCATLAWHALQEALTKKQGETGAFSVSLDDPS